jgi:mono/diheme cytochrome c family protein
MKRTFGLAALCAALLAGVGAAAQKVQDDKRPARQRDAATLFAKSCASCHGKDGRAQTFKAKFNRARDLTDASWQREAGDERIANSIANGRGKMPEFGKKLSQPEVDSLVAYVRGLKK